MENTRFCSGQRQMRLEAHDVIHGSGAALSFRSCTTA